MGCGSSAADRAIRLDGHENVIDYIIAKNSQIYLEKYIPDVYKTTSGNIKRLKNRKLNEINQYEKLAKKSIQQKKASIQQRQPGSIAMAEAMHKISFEQLYGLDQTIKKFLQQKSNVHNQYEQQEKQILKEIRQQYQKIYNSINASSSKLSHINALPEVERIKAFQWGNKYAQNQIEIHSRNLKQKLDKKFDFSNFQHRFDNIASTRILQQILDEGKQKASKIIVEDTRCVTC